MGREARCGDCSGTVLSLVHLPDVQPGPVVSACKRQGGHAQSQTRELTGMVRSQVSSTPLVHCALRQTELCPVQLGKAATLGSMTCFATRTTQEREAPAMGTGPLECLMGLPCNLLRVRPPCVNVAVVPSHRHSPQKVNTWSLASSDPPHPQRKVIRCWQTPAVTTPSAHAPYPLPCLHTAQ